MIGAMAENSEVWALFCTVYCLGRNPALLAIWYKCSSEA